MLGLNQHYTNRDDLIENFLSGNAREAYAYGRLYTRESPEGNGVELIAYGNEVIARLEGDDLTFFVGHHGSVSRTVTGYIKLFGSILSNGNYSNLHVDVRESEAPTNGYLARNIGSSAAKYIEEYVDFTTENSPVDDNAVREVREALKDILRHEFGGE